MRRTLTLLAVAAAVVVSAGCGGGGDDGAETGGDGGPTAKGPAYDGAFELCSAGLQETAQIYAVEPTREAVVTVVTELVSGGQARDEEAARQGCLDALDQAKKE